MKKPRPGEIAAAFDHDIGELLEFCGRVLEDANEHWIAHALWAMNAGEVELAKKFLQLSQDAEDAGELTPELKKKSDELLDEFGELDEEEDPADVEGDDEEEDGDLPEED